MKGPAARISSMRLCVDPAEELLASDAGFQTAWQATMLASYCSLCCRQDLLLILQRCPVARCAGPMHNLTRQRPNDLTVKHVVHSHTVAVIASIRVGSHHSIDSPVTRACISPQACQPQVTVATVKPLQVRRSQAAHDVGYFGQLMTHHSMVSLLQPASCACGCALQQQQSERPSVKFCS